MENRHIHVRNFWLNISSARNYFFTFLSAVRRVVWWIPLCSRVIIIANLTDQVTVFYSLMSSITSVWTRRSLSHIYYDDIDIDVLNTDLLFSFHASISSLNLSSSFLNRFKHEMDNKTINYSFMSLNLRSRTNLYWSTKNVIWNKENGKNILISEIPAEIQTNSRKSHSVR